MTKLSKLLIDLRNLAPSLEGSYPVSDIPFINRHKIGINRKGYSIFFLHCNLPSTANKLNYDLEMIRVRFDVQCKLDLGDGMSQEDQYAIVELKDGYIELENYFLEIIHFMIKNLPEKLSVVTLRKEIDIIINLFNKISQPPLKSIQGLWAELLVIENSKHPAYLIKSWHLNKRDCFDFNDGVDKLEVKSTSKNTRIHTFSYQQLNPNLNTILLIASVMVLQTGIGTGVFELASRIENRLDDLADVIKLREIIATTLGDNLNISDNFFFDYQYSVDSLKFYDCSIIPTIPLDVIPKEISNIHFDIDLSKVKPVNLNSIISNLTLSL